MDINFGASTAKGLFYTSELKYFAIAASLMKGSLLSLSLAALYVSKLAASISVASIARWCCMAW